MFYGWTVVGACALISMYISGTVHMGFTTIFNPIASEMDWSYTHISLASSLRGFEVGLLVPVAGMIMDRWGPRKLLFGGLVVVAAGMILISRVQSLAMFYAAFGLICVGTSTTPATLMMATVANWFKKSQGLAMGITSGGVSLGGLMIPVMTGLVDACGWRQAMVIAAIGVCTIPLPLSLLLRHKPEPYGMLPYGALAGSEGLAASGGLKNKQGPRIGVMEALRNPVFLVLAIGALCHVMAVHAIMTHIMPFFTHIGVERARSGLIIGAVPLIGIAGRIGFGWLMDRIDKIMAATLALALTALGTFFFMLVTPNRPVLALAFIISFGVGWGGFVPMIAGLVIQFFGRYRMATITGCIGSVMMVGILLGAPLAGWTFDRYGSYRAAWLFMGLIITAATAAFFFFLRYFEGQRQGPPAKRLA